MTPKKIDSFQAIYKEEFKEEISEKEALEKGTRLINLFKAIIGPYPIKK